jgi:hypothetical protein
MTASRALAAILHLTHGECHRSLPDKKQFSGNHHHEIDDVVDLSLTRSHRLRPDR